MKTLHRPGRLACGIAGLALTLLAAPAFAQFGGRWGIANNEVPLVERYDRDGDGRLNAAERQAVRDEQSGNSSGRPGRNWPPYSTSAAAPKGAMLKPADVKKYGNEPLYDPGVLRTLFLTFENQDWEQELAFFYNTDVEVPATVVVDGKTYPDVGVHFRGQTSFKMVSDGQKRSLNLSFDDVHGKQRLLGYRTLNLLNSAADPTFLRAVLYMQIARDYLPAPKANYVRVVINGESWGIYVNLQQFNTDFTREAAGGSDARWKVPGSPRSRGGGLAYLGEDPQLYKRYYEIRSKDKPESWAKLIHLTRVLNETPPDRLVAALEPVLAVDEVLRFLAVENALINNDGYWTRGSDYSLYIDEQGRFHVVPHDVNETLRPIENFGWGRFDGTMQGSGAIDLGLFAGTDDASKPLLSKLLAVPELRAKYLGYIRDIAEKWLTWDRIGPLAAEYQSLIAADVKADVRKLGSTEAFTSGVTVDAPETAFGNPIATPGMSLKTFVEQRRAYLLNAVAVHERGRNSARAP